MINSTLTDNFDSRIHAELMKAFQFTLSSNEQLINNLEVAKTVAGWLKEANEDKKKIPSMIVNEAIRWLLSSIVPRLSTFLINSIKIETGVYLNKPSIKQIEVSFGLKPYIDYVMKLNDVVTKKARITFSVSLPGKWKIYNFLHIFRVDISL